MSSCTTLSALSRGILTSWSDASPGSPFKRGLRNVALAARCCPVREIGFTRRCEAKGLRGRLPSYAKAKALLHQGQSGLQSPSCQGYSLPFCEVESLLSVASTSVQHFGSVLRPRQNPMPRASCWIKIEATALNPSDMLNVFPGWLLPPNRFSGSTSGGEGMLRLWHARFQPTGRHAGLVHGYGS